MAVLGQGRAHGACSLLHAAGTGYGASMAIDLPILVRVLDKKSKRDVHDDDGLLPHVVASWEAAGHELPLAEGDLHWAVQSKIPAREGLKSSSALCVAAVRALCDATDTSLEMHQIVAIAERLGARRGGRRVRDEDGRAGGGEALAVERIRRHLARGQQGQQRGRVAGRRVRQRARVGVAALRDDDRAVRREEVQLLEPLEGLVDGARVVPTLGEPLAPRHAGTQALVARRDGPLLRAIVLYFFS